MNIGSKNMIDYTKFNYTTAGVCKKGGYKHLCKPKPPTFTRHPFNIITEEIYDQSTP